MSMKKNISQAGSQLQIKFENSDSKKSTTFRTETKVIKLSSVNVKNNIRDFSKSVILNSKSF